MIYFILSVFVFVFAIIILYFSKTITIPSKLQGAERYINEGNHQSAIELLKRVLDIEKGHPKARFLLAKSYYMAAQYILAISELKNLLAGTAWKKNLKESEIRYFLAEIYHQTKQWGKEIGEFKIIQAINPNDPYVNRKLGIVYYEQNQFEDSYKILSRLIESGTDDVEVLFPYAVSAYETNNISSAGEVFERIINIDPNSIISHYYLALAYRKDKKFAKAIDHFERATEDPSVRDKSWINLGDIYIEQEDWNKAIQSLKKIILSDEKETMEAAYNLAYCYERVGNFNEAMRVWEELNTSYNNYRNVRGKIEEYLEISQSEELAWFFSLSQDKTKEAMSSFFNKLGLYIVKMEAVNDRFFKFIAFRNKSQLDTPILIEIFKNTNEINEVGLLDFKKDMEIEKAIEGIIATPGTISAKGSQYLEGTQIRVIEGNKFIKILSDLKAQHAKT